MKKIRMIVAGMVAAMPLALFGQPCSKSFVARQLENDGHWFAGNLLVESLVSQYHLREAGTEERLAEWTANYPTAPDLDRMSLLRANLLVEQGRYDEALLCYAKGDKSLMSESERSETVLCEAIARIHKGEYAKAEELLAGIARNVDYALDVLYYQGYARYAQGDFKAALPCFEAVAESFDYRRKAPVYAADCLVHTGEPKQALEMIRTYQKQWGQTDLALEAKRVEGEALYGEKNYYDAIIALKQYVDESAEVERTPLYKLGMSYMQTKAYGSAATQLSRSALMAEEGGDPMAQNALYHAGNAYLHMKNKQQASMAFARAAEMAFDREIQEESLYNYALTLHDGGTTGFGEAVHTFENFLNEYPTSRYRTIVEQHLTEVYFTTKNYPAALASINKIQSPSSEILRAKQTVLYNLGVQKFIDGDYDSAVSFMQQSMETGNTAGAGLSKEAAEALYWKGESEYRLGKYDQALADLQKYTASGSANQKNQSLAHYAIGYTLTKQKKYAEALPHYRQFAASNAGDDRTRADALNRLGDCYFAARQYDEAYTAYQQAIDTHRSGGDYALLQQAFISGLRGDYTKKVELLAQLDQKYEDSEYSVDALFEKGRAYLQSGEKDKALQTFNQLTTRHPQTMQARRAGNEIALILAEQGRTDAAIAAYKQVIANYPNTQESQTALANLKDLFAEQGRVNEYAALAAEAGKQLSPSELDDMVLGAALRAVSNGNHSQAFIHYQQLEAQTTSADLRSAAQAGQMRSAFAAHDFTATIDVATRMLADASRMTPALQAEALLLRAESYLATSKPVEAVADLQAAKQDLRTVHGAEAAVRLAQYAYDTKQYKSAEDVLAQMIDLGTPHTYWLARAFVLLADVYAQTDRQIEAKQYLLSLKSNYTESEEINRMIEERLAKL